MKVLLTLPALIATLSLVNSTPFDNELTLSHLFSVAAANSSSNSNSTSNSNTTCATGVHMIIARASTENPGQGIIGAVATQVQQTVPGSDSEAVDYPATLTNYTSSEASGVAQMRSLIQSYTKRCPKSKIALLGYSQGAQVTGDVICGTSENNFNTTAPLDAATAKKIVAIIQMGDPTHVTGQSQDVGTSTKNGIFPRINNACGGLANVTKSYCDSDDKFCDSGTSIQVHLSYVTTYGNVAAQFIVGRVNGSIA